MLVSEYNPEPVGNTDDGDGDEPSHQSSRGHSCFDKAREIRRRTGIILGLDTHDVISEMCREWGTSNADEFYMRMKSMSDDQLKSEVDEAKRRLARKKIKKPIELLENVSTYA